MTREWDTADAYALLDDGEARLARCPNCDKFVCTCDEEPPAEMRARTSRGRRAR